MYPDYKYRPTKRVKLADGSVEPRSSHTQATGCDKCGGTAVATVVHSPALRLHTDSHDEGGHHASDTVRGSKERDIIHLPPPTPASAVTHTASTEPASYRLPVSVLPSHYVVPKQAPRTMSVNLSREAMLGAAERNLEQRRLTHASTEHSAGVGGADAKPTFGQASVIQGHSGPQYASWRAAAPPIALSPRKAILHHSSTQAMTTNGSLTAAPMHPQARSATGFGQHRQNIQTESSGREQTLTLAPIRTSNLASARNGSIQSASGLSVGHAVRSASAHWDLITSPDACVAFFAKLDLLNRVAIPLPMKQGESRGLLIAVEGTNTSAIAAITAWLHDALRKDVSREVMYEQGPASLTSQIGINQQDIFDHLKTIHGRNRTLRNLLLGDGKVKSPSHPSPAATSESTGRDEHSTSEAPATIPNSPSPSPISNKETTKPPLMLLDTYLVTATNAFAREVTIEDLYGPESHWQWTACLWRGVVGADLTIYVRDATDVKDPDLVENLVKKNVIMVTSDKVRRDDASGDDDRHGFVGGVTTRALRRLAFEVGEWVFSMEKRMQDV